MNKYKSKSSYKLGDSTVFSTESEIDRTTEDLLHEKVLIDNIEYLVIGVEFFSKAGGIKKGETIGLLVKTNINE